MLGFGNDRIGLFCLSPICHIMVIEIGWWGRTVYPPLSSLKRRGDKNRDWEVTFVAVIVPSSQRSPITLVVAISEIQSLFMWLWESPSTCLEIGNDRFSCVTQKYCPSVDFGVWILFELLFLWSNCKMFSYFHNYTGLMASLSVCTSGLPLVAPPVCFFKFLKGDPLFHSLRRKRERTTFSKQLAST